MGKLTPKMQKFVDYYIETDNATQSYKLAGYSASNDNIAGVEGHKLLKNPKIAMAIEERMTEMASDRIASAEEVLEFLTDTMREKRNYVKDRLHAAELLGKRHKLFTEKIEMDASVDIEVNLTGFDEEE
ncbi:MULTISPECIES: terminase small subunit [Gammaproteobacteria]|uniref:terminase small subunit n=1 Tax=Acinetobacter sp. HRXRD-152 TaxID=3404808 RepID=UPI003BB77D4A